MSNQISDVTSRYRVPLAGIIFSMAVLLSSVSASAQTPELAPPPDETADVQTEQVATGEGEQAAPVEEETSEQPAASSEETSAETAAAEEEEEEDEGPDIGPALGMSVIGAASLVGGILYLVDSGDTGDNADAAAAAGQANRSQSLRDRADREQILGIVLTGLGVAALGGATYFWITALTGEEPADQPAETAQPDVSFAPSFGPDGSAILFFQGTF